MLLFFIFTGLVFLLCGKYFQYSFLYFIGFGLIVYGILTTLGWLLARYVIPGNRISIAKNVIAGLKITGEEQILDVATGRGIFAIEAAKKLSVGRVTAIDLWEGANSAKVVYHHKFSQPTGNKIENAIKNAEIEDVSEKIRFMNMDANNLEFDSDSFDIVICGYVISHLWKFSGNILKNIKKVIKNKGKFVIIDNVIDSTYFLLSTPHLFLLSLLRGTKATKLKYNNWVRLLESNGFVIQSVQKNRGIIILNANIDKYN